MSHQPPFTTLPATSRSLNLHEHHALGTTHQSPATMMTASSSSSATHNSIQDLTPVAWSTYYDQRTFIQIPIQNGGAAATATVASSFTAAATSSSSSSSAAAHSTSSASASSSATSLGATTHTDEFCVYTAAPASLRERPPFLVVFLHGGGQSSLAFACVAGLLKPSMSILAFDMRGHGATHTNDEADLSMARLVDDTISVIRTVHPSPPPLLLVGHSLGGALAVHVAASKKLPVIAMVVIDLVEGTAIASLDHMDSVIASRPQHFLHLEDAVHWSLLCGAMRNPTSARVSIPDQLVQDKAVLTADALITESASETSPSPSDSSSSTAAAAASSPSSPPVPLVVYRWRTDLMSSKPHWSGWFIGLSSLFLSCAIPKMLLLASSDRLDTPLMVAHMQGKMQLEVMSQAGHSVQEDQPRETARKLLEFVQRHKLHTMNNAWVQQANKQQQKGHN